MLEMLVFFCQHYVVSSTFQLKKKKGTLTQFSCEKSLDLVYNHKSVTPLAFRSHMSQCGLSYCIYAFVGAGLFAYERYLAKAHC